MRAADTGSRSGSVQEGGSGVAIGEVAGGVSAGEGSPRAARGYGTTGEGSALTDREVRCGGIRAGANKVLGRPATFALGAVTYMISYLGFSALNVMFLMSMSQLELSKCGESGSCGGNKCDSVEDMSVSAQSLMIFELVPGAFLAACHLYQARLLATGVDESTKTFSGSFRVAVEFIFSLVGFFGYIITMEIPNDLREDDCYKRYNEGSFYAAILPTVGMIAIGAMVLSLLNTFARNVGFLPKESRNSAELLA